MIVSCAEMQAAEKALFATGVEAESLMEEAGRACADAIRQYFHAPARARLYVGKGHNGGDALVAGRVLSLSGWTVDCQLAVPAEELAPLTAKKLREFQQAREKRNQLPPLIGRSPAILIDGLLGLGADGPMREPILSLANQMNQIRSERNATTFAIDIPSGLNGDTGAASDGAVIADFTLAIQYAKPGLLTDDSVDHVGRLIRIPVPRIQSEEGDTSRVILDSHHLSRCLPAPEYSQHKGQSGRVGIVAGSRGMTGAAILSSTAALRAGGGLVTLFARGDETWELLASLAPPEVMVRPVQDFREVLQSNLDAIGIGPGIGRAHDEEILHILDNSSAPVIIDADALNALADSSLALENSVGARLLTPHPGEARRLCSDTSGSREDLVRKLQKKFGHAVVLKGSRSLIADEGQPLAFNTTGNPGMSTGGMGDVLTGMCAAFAARNQDLYEVGCLGSWLLGRAAELAVWEQRIAPEGLVATDVVQKLPHAIRELRERSF